MISLVFLSVQNNVISAELNWVNIYRKHPATEMHRKKEIGDVLSMTSIENNYRVGLFDPGGLRGT